MAVLSIEIEIKDVNITSQGDLDEVVTDVANALTQVCGYEEFALRVIAHEDGTVIIDEEGDEEIANTDNAQGASRQREKLLDKIPNRRKPARSNPRKQRRPSGDVIQ